MRTRLFVSAPLSNADELVLDGEQARYLGRVLRLTTGDRIGVFNSDAGEWQAEITALSKATVTLRLLEQVSTVVESPLRTHLVQGISRGERMDFVVQKATELGVKRITPVLTDHGMVKLDTARSAKRQQHWQRIAASACEQSGRIRPPLIDTPLPLNSWFGSGTSAGSTQLVLHPDATGSLGSIDTVEKKICFLVGPEGGLSEREYDDATVAGFTAVALGPRVLRTETAALAVLAIAQALWGDLRNT